MEESFHSGLGRFASFAGGALISLAAGACTAELGASSSDSSGDSPQGSSPAQGGDGDGDSLLPVTNDAPGELPPAAPGRAVLPRLTVSQYEAAVANLYSDSITYNELESDNRPDFFSVIGSARQPITETAVALFWDAGIQIAEQVAADPEIRERILPCAAAPAYDASCVEAFFDDHVATMLRRPMTAEERARYGALFESTSEGDLWQGLRFTLSALLSSPAFLYRHEQTQADGARNAYDDFALASRLAFLVTNEPPDEALLEQAAAGNLRDPNVLSAELDRLYERALSHGLHIFFDEYFDLEAAGILDFEGYSPEDDARLGEAMRHEALLMALEASSLGVDYRSLMSTRRTFLNGILADFYGESGISGEDFVAHEFAEGSPRAGLLTTGAFLTADAAQDRTKPSNRGLYVQFRLRCQSIPDPPDGIPPLDAIGDPAAMSVREILEQHAADPACAGCHDAMDPIGIAMEDFDQFGLFRTTYPDGSPVDAESVINDVAFSGAKGLGAILGTDEEVTRCLTRQVYRYASARVEEESEAAYIEEIHQQFKDSGFQFIELLRATLRSEGFLTARIEEQSL